MAGPVSLRQRFEGLHLVGSFEGVIQPHTHGNGTDDRNDLKRVTEILETLERGDTFVPRSETITERTLLKNERARLHVLAAQLQTDVQTLQQSETYQAINQLTDWDVYFAEKRQQLTEQMEALAV